MRERAKHEREIRMSERGKHEDGELSMRELT